MKSLSILFYVSFLAICLTACSKAGDNGIPDIPEDFELPEGFDGIDGLTDMPDAEDTPTDQEIECEDGETLCGDECVDLLTDIDHCGGCGEACDEGMVCVAGECREGCEPGELDCEGTCVDPTDDPENCGGCGIICPAELHADPICVAGECSYQCHEGWSDLDDEPGCEIECTYVSPDEDCNGVDDNCNGVVDEGFDCPMNRETACTTICGSIGRGLCGLDCTYPDPEDCVPPDEMCNGIDDDCDDEADNGFDCARGTEVACITDCGTPGTGVCTSTCETPSGSGCASGSETCNGLDDNCNGSADEIFDCVMDEGVSCITTCGSLGSGFCSSDCMLPTAEECTPPDEACNGIDDDCDDVCDNGFGCCRAELTECTTSCGTTGVSTCSATCTPGACSPPPEECNGMDDDCDDVCDNGFSCCQGAEGSCTTTCGSTGDRVCSMSCRWGACAPPAEECNGMDDDCDDVCDNGYDCCRGETGDCTTSCGSTGIGTCTSTCTWSSCTPPGEVCNGADDDCDTTCDNGFACCQGSESTCTTSCGTTGARTCSSTCAWGSCAPPDEICNGEDDDCDGVCDDGFACCRGDTGSCSTSCGSAGTRMCSSSCTWGSCSPPDEICNGADDDCDTICDEGFGCCADSIGSCTTSCGSTGSRACSSTCTWGSCQAPAEICNGVDDDCDGSCDEGWTCCVGDSTGCSTSCGSSGSRICNSSCAWGSCTPPPEICNGEDDDCDGVCDDGYTCCAGDSGSCPTSCGSAGTRTCTGSCTWSSCNPPGEECNGADDDCDTVCDNGFTCCAGTIGSCFTSCGSTGSRMCSGSCTWGSCTAPAEICNGIDDDCDTLCDEGWSCCAGESTTCPTSCGSTGTRTCSGSCAWGSCAPPSETCNGADDDCDTLCDEDWACCAGDTGTCPTSCGTTGTRSCNGSCAWGSCNPPAEECNGIDDNCDTQCDEGWACCAGTTDPCTSSCGTPGTRLCSPSCTLGSCTPPSESCNGLDDDCDTLCDEGWACCLGTTGSCTNPVGVAGTWTCEAGCNWGECCAAAETCGNGYDDDCNGIPDDGCGLPNDDCSSPGSVTIGGTTSGTNIGAIDDYSGSCTGTSGVDVVYSFTLGSTSDIFIGVHGEDAFDPVIYLSSSCGGSTYCNDDAYVGVTSSVIIQDGLASGTYYLVVDGWGGSTGNFTIEIYTNGDWAQGDGCGEPYRLYDGVGGDTWPQWDDYTPSCQSSDSYDEVFYFIVESTRTVTTDTCDEFWDTVLFYRDDCDSGPDLDCNDDDCGLQSTVSHTFLPGIYFLFTDGWSGDSGSYNLNVSGL